MAYTASALSFMLENLGKTVILTGSQVPLAEARNDAVDNLLGALTIAGHFIIPEVSLYFHNTVRCPSNLVLSPLLIMRSRLTISFLLSSRQLLRGNRTIKMSAVDFDAFKSPNFEAIVKVGINIGENPARLFSLLSSSLESESIFLFFPVAKMWIGTLYSFPTPLTSFPSSQT